MVVEVLLARDQLLAVLRREEEAAALVVAEQLDRLESQPARSRAGVAGRDVQLEQPVRDVGVVVQVAGTVALPSRKLRCRPVLQSGREEAASERAT